MADNVAITPGTGTIVATDDVGGGVQVQRVKVTFGVDGVASDVTGSAGLPTTPVASEVHIGAVGGATNVVKVVLAVSTTPAYTALDLIGGKITIANAVRVSGGTGDLKSIQILDRSNQKPAGIIYIFDADPTVGTYTDNAAPTVLTDDIKVIGQVAVGQGDYVTTNNKAFAKPSFNPIPVKAASGTSLYAIFQTTSTPTFAATTDVQIAFGFGQD